MKQVLVVWNEPETISFVPLVVDESRIEALKRFHGNYIVPYKSDISDEIAAFFYDDDGFKYENEKLDKPLEKVGFDLVIFTGIS